MAGVLRAERVWVETFTGMQVTQFARLLKVVRERGGNGTLLGGPSPVRRHLLGETTSSSARGIG